MKPRPFIASLCIAVVLLITLACGGGGGGGNPPLPVPPTITSFLASPSTITLGQSAQLTAVFSNGTGVIDNSVGTITSGIAVNVTPSATTTFTLTVTNSPTALVARTVTVTVTTDSASSTIGPNGGTLTTPSDTVQLVVPPNTVSADSNFTIAITQDASFGSLGQIAPGYELGPAGLNFNTPVTLNYKYDPTALPMGINETNLQLAYAAGKETIPILGSIVDTTNHIISAPVYHFSTILVVGIYQPLGTPLHPDFNGVIAYSNYHLGPDPHYTDPKDIGPPNILPDGFNTGEEWQCAEYINRYYWIHYNQDIQLSTGGNNAAQYWDKTGWLNRGLIGYNNGNSDTPPQAGDIIVFETNSGEGHVAIITGIFNNNIGIIQQNWYLNDLDANATLDYDKINHIIKPFTLFNGSSSSYLVKGWLRSNRSVVSIASFTANPTSIAAGQSATLTPVFTNATSASINNGVGTVISGTGYTVTPSATTTYTLTANGTGGPVTRAVTVTVTTGCPLEIISFTVTPATITTGQSATLTPVFKGATSASIDNGVGPVISGMGYTVTPAVTTTYRLVISYEGEGGGCAITPDFGVTLTVNP